MKNKEKNITMAGGKIICPRCQATSKRSKLQCGRPALKGKTVCDFHGGKSTGPKTKEGKEKSRQANLKSGKYTQYSMLQNNRALLNLAYMEDLMHLLRMTNADRTRGPKPSGYMSYKSSTQLILAIEENKKTVS